MPIGKKDYNPGLYSSYTRNISLRFGRKVVVVTDNVRYHHAVLHKEWRKAAEPWFTLLLMPPYSPDLNPIEWVSKLTRRVATHNKYFPSMDDMIASDENIFDEWHYGDDTVRHQCAIT
jgi:transposase